MVIICIRVLDANKAFNGVDYSVLFRKLVSRGVPTYILRLLWNWYGHHYARILWTGVQSDNFSICNGVRQGGILSPFLFGVYIDELSRYLHPSINKYWLPFRQYDYYHFLFADDAVVFAPSAKGLKKLLDACSEFAVTHNVIFNVIKSQCLRSRTAPSYRPTFRLCGDALPYTESYKIPGSYYQLQFS